MRKYETFFIVGAHASAYLYELWKITSF